MKQFALEVTQRQITLPAMPSNNKAEMTLHKQDLCNALSSCSTHNPEFCSSQLYSNMPHTQDFLALAPIQQHHNIIIKNI